MQQMTEEIWKQVEFSIKEKINEKINLEKKTEQNKMARDFFQVGRKLKLLTDSLNNIFFDIEDLLDEYDFEPINLTENEPIKGVQLYSVVNNSITSEKMEYRKKLLKSLGSFLSDEEMDEITNLKNNHSLRIYELLRRYNGEFNVKFLNLKKFLSLSQSSYRQIVDFRRAVLEVVRLEIDKNTSKNLKYTIVYEEEDTKNEDAFIRFWFE